MTADPPSDVLVPDSPADRDAARTIVGAVDGWRTLPTLVSDDGSSVRLTRGAPPGLDDEGLLRGQEGRQHHVVGAHGSGGGANNRMIVAFVDVVSARVLEQQAPVRSDPSGERAV